MTLVVDASAVVALLLRRSGDVLIEEQLRQHVGHLHAPHLVDPEILSALRRYVMGGALKVDEAESMLVDAAELPVLRHPHGSLLGRALDIRDTVTGYDAMYVALAEALDAVLLTADGRLARGARTLGVDVVLAG